MAESVPFPPAGSNRPAGRWGGSVRRVVRVVVAASVLFVAFDLSRRFDAAEVALEPVWFIVALVPAVVGVLVQMLAWRRLIRQLTGQSVALLPAAVVYLDAQMARYTPGKVGLLAVRVAAASRLGVPARLMVSSLFIELLSWTGMGILVGTVTLLGSSATTPLAARAWVGAATDTRAVALPLALAALVGLLGLCWIPRARFPARLLALLSAADGASRPKDPLVPAVFLLWHALHWLCWVLAGAVLGLGLGAPLGVAAFAGGVLCLAVVLGFLAVVAPAGAGVREVVISVLMAPVVGPSAALVLGLTARAVSLLADVATWALVHSVALRQRQSSS